MQVSVETTQGLERRLTISVPADAVDSAVKSRLQQLAKTQRINGFRPGKVPVSVIKKRFGQAVRQEVAGDVMQQNFYQAIVQEKIQPAGMPKFELTKDEDGQDLEFVASFEVYPEVEVKGVSDIEIEKPVVDITDEDLDNMMETLQKQHASWKEVKRKAKKDDKVIIDFVGTVDGEEFEGGKAEDFALELGQGRMIPGFEKPLVGAKAGEEVTIEVTFPEDYHAENLKGKEAKFSIKLNKVEARELPELNEEFVSKFGAADGIEGLKAEVRKNMERELKQAVKNRIKEQAIDGLVNENNIDVPSALIDQEIGVLRQQAAQRFGGNTEAADQLPRELFEEQAKRRVVVGLLLGEVIKTEELKADDEKVKAIIEEMATAYEDPTEVIAYYEQNEQMMNNMRNVALEEQAIDAIIAKAQVSDKEVSFNELMNQQPA